MMVFPEIIPVYKYLRNYIHLFFQPGYSVNQSGIIPPYTYVRNCQTTASQYNNQIMRQMIPFSGTISPYYTAAAHVPATQSQQLQYHLQYQQHMQQYQHQQQAVYPEV